MITLATIPSRRYYRKRCYSTVKNL